MLKKILRGNWKLYFCYMLLLFSFLFIIVLLIIKPIKIETHYIYQYGNEILKDEIKFPIVQNIVFEHEDLKVLNVFLSNSSLEEKIYSVKLLDNDGNEYFNSKLSDNTNGMFSISLDNLNLKKNYDYVLEIDYDLAESAEVVVKDSNNKKIYLNGLTDKTLEMTVNYAVENNTYFWYSFLIAVVALTLFPVARGEKDEIIKK